MKIATVSHYNKGEINLKPLGTVDKANYNARIFPNHMRKYQRAVKYANSNELEMNHINSYNTEAYNPPG